MCVGVCVYVCVYARKSSKFFRSQLVSYHAAYLNRLHSTSARNTASNTDNSFVPVQEEHQLSLLKWKGSFRLIHSKEVEINRVQTAPAPHVTL